MQPYFNFQGNELFAVVAFLGTGLTLLLCAIALPIFLRLGKKRLAQGSGWVALSLLAVYLVTLLGFSLRSREQVLAPGEEKYFCEVDCHLAYSVVAVRKTPLPPLEGGVREVLYQVRVRVRFDRKTISPGRGDFPLHPNPRCVTVADEAGRRFEPTSEAEGLVVPPRGKAASLEDPLRPGESYVVDLAFRLPSDALAPRLLIIERSWLTRLLIGHENSFLHKKTSFSLAQESPDAAQ
ncbi:MAG: hypothetical protein ACRD2Q_09150 [Terriglobales bacterium]